MTRTDLAWLAGPVLEVAPRLLGARITTVLPDGVVTVRLTEVEAYDGADDPGSHAFRGRSARNAVMFGPAGYLYVYRHMGLHVCANVVTGVEGDASAVLLRAGQVVAGTDLARERRRRRGALASDVDLARGPARLADSLGVTLDLYGAALLGGTTDGAAGTAATDGAPAVRLELAPHPPLQVATGPRVGVSGVGGEAERFPWRFWLPGEPTVSSYRPAAPRRARTPRATLGPHGARGVPPDESSAPVLP